MAEPKRILQAIVANDKGGLTGYICTKDKQEEFQYRERKSLINTNSSLVSVIIPVYNVEKYLAKCLDSIIGQTYTKLEIILVDDGSTDGSGVICDAYAEQDKRIHVIHKLNAGVSAARNTGLKLARGEAVVFADADDTVASTYLEHLVTEFVKGYDVVISGINIVYDDSVNVRAYDREIIGASMKADYAELLKERGGMTLLAPYGKIFRKSLLDAYKLQYKEDLRYGEDALFNLHYFAVTASYKLIPAADYNYIQRANVGAMHTFKEERIAEHIKEIRYKNQALHEHGYLNIEYIYIKTVIATVYSMLRTLKYADMSLGTKLSYILQIVRRGCCEVYTSADGMSLANKLRYFAALAGNSLLVVRSFMESR